MKKRVFALALCALTALGCIPTDSLPPLIRLHVLAASDSEQDQALKLIVRDAVLEEAQSALADCADYEQAYAIISERLDEIEQAAYAAAEGEPVSVMLGREEYPERDYGAFTLPEGEYMSLRVGIGEAQGRNWWCVVYPSLCMPDGDAAAQIPEMIAKTPLRSVVWDWIRGIWRGIGAESGAAEYV